MSAKNTGLVESIPDWGDWGNGPDDPYTPDEKMRRFYFSANSGTVTFWGTARVPPSWTKKRIREHGLLRYSEDVNVSFDVLSLKHFVT